MDNAFNNNFGGAAVAPEAAPAKKNKTVLVAIIALLIGILGTTIVFLCLNGGFGAENKDKKDDSNTAKEATETEITDSAVIADLKGRATLTLTSWSTDYSDGVTIYGVRSLKGYQEKTTGNKLGNIIRNFNTKTESRLMTKAEWAKVQASASDLAVVKEHAGNIASRADGYIGLTVHDELDAIRSDYEKYYGALGNDYPSSADGYPIICGDYFYLSSIKAYINVNGCGDAFEDATKVEYYKFSEKGEKAYVYFISQVMQYAAHDEAGNEMVQCHGDLDAQKLLKGNTQSCPEISLSNTEEYVHYRVVFEKDDKGNYIYKTVEKVEE